MTLYLSPNQSQIQTALATFLTSILPTGTEVIEGQDNRTSEPAASEFVVVTCIARPRLTTNIDEYLGADFNGSISGNTLIVTTLVDGEIVVGDALFGTNVAANTQIIAFGSGTGGLGTYTLNNTQSVSSEAMASGSIELTQPTQLDFQLDVHAPDIRTSSDMAQTISTAFRDDIAVQSFLTSGYPIAPLYADDPRQIPFINENQQYESRYVVEVHLQVDQSLAGFPQQYANAAGSIPSLSATTLP